MQPRRRRRDAIEGWLRAPVDGASTAFVRLGVGLTLGGVLAAAPLLPRVMANLSGTGLRLPELGFTWLWLPRAPEFYTAALLLLAVAAFSLGLGRRPRLCAGVLAASLAYAVLADATLYSSTYYLVVLICVLFVLIPPRPSAGGSRWSPTIPRWGLLLLRFQLAVVYGFAAVAKLDGDWLAGEPIAAWLARPLPWLPAPISAALREPWVAPTLAWGGLALDALIVPLLLWRRTRALAFVAVVLFHSFNGLVLHIFPLPIVATVLSTVFFDPAWPRRLGRRLGLTSADTPEAPPQGQGPAPLSNATRIFIAVFVALQLLMPLRHLLLPGDVAWNEAGATYAWRLRARDKSVAMSLRRIDRATGERLPGDAFDGLTPHQLDLITRTPDALLLFAHHLAAEAAREGRTIEVRANAQASLNGRPFAPYITDDVDLAATPRSWGAPTWVSPSPRD